MIGRTIIRPTNRFSRPQSRSGIAMSMRSFRRIGLTRPMRLVSRMALRTTATWALYGRKNATIRRSVLPRRSFGTGSKGSVPPNPPNRPPPPPPPRTRPVPPRPPAPLVAAPSRPNPPPLPLILVTLSRRLETCILQPSARVAAEPRSAEIALAALRRRLRFRARPIDSDAALRQKSPLRRNVRPHAPPKIPAAVPYYCRCIFGRLGSAR